ncbi:MAG: alpha-L-rhamnosidase [Ruminococcaceae bacterium]|nr:alpha-L-rhamnosidase [Oscillospiraceae bacterium]
MTYMRTFTGKWITNKDFYDLKPINVFHKAEEPFEYTPREEIQNKHILFRCEFTLDDINGTKIFISADDYYKLYINGKFVSMGPCPGYNFEYYYNEIDISDFVTVGKNTIAVHTYYQGLINRAWVSGDERHGLIFDIENNDKVILSSCESVKCKYHTGFSSLGLLGYQTAFRECYDAGCDEAGFEKEDFDDSDWDKSYIKTYDDYTLVPQPVKPLVVYNKKPVISERKDNKIFLDFGQEMVGYLTFKAKGKKGSKITLHFSEELNDDGSPRYELRCNCIYEEEMILSGKEDILNQYDYKAFRYAEIIFDEGTEIDNDSIEFIVRHYPYEEKVFNIKDEKLAPIVKLCLASVKYGTQEVYMDCPTREKGQYICDCGLIGLSHIVATGDNAMFKKFLYNIASSDFICKGLMTEAPCSHMQEIADYSLQFSFFVWKYYEMTGDKETLKDMLPVCEGVWEYFKKYETKEGLIESVTEKWNMVDWPKNLRDDYDFPIEKPIGPGLHNVINAFYIGLLVYIDKIYDELGIDKKTDAESKKKAFINAFYNKDTHLYNDSESSTHSAIHSNVLPLLFDIIPDDECKGNILNMIDEKRLTKCNFFMGAFMLFALQKEGEKELLYNIITDERAWVNMLKEGATTTFEAWGKEQKWNTSLCHPVGAIPLIFLDDIN